MFRLLPSCLFFLIAYFIAWLCLVKILYRNDQCIYIRQNNSSQNTINQSFHLSPIDTRLKLHHFTILGTHNSYHEKSLFYKYSHSKLEQQLTYGIRQIELDIHLMSNNDVIYHLQILDDKTNCYCLSHCLERIVDWSRINSYHYPIYLFIEIKQMFYEDLFTGLHGGVKCGHFQMLKEQLLHVIPMQSFILPVQIRGNQSSINDALKKPRRNEFIGNFAYDNYGWPPVYLSLGKIMPIFIDDVHNIVEKLISTCETLANFFFIAQTNANLDYASIISISNPLNSQQAMTDSTNNGQLIRILLGYNGRQLMEKYRQARKYGAHIISTDSVHCDDTELCQSIANDFRRNASILCNAVVAPNFCNATMLTL